MATHAEIMAASKAFHDKRTNLSEAEKSQWFYLSMQAALEAAEKARFKDNINSYLPDSAFSSVESW